MHPSTRTPSYRSAWQPCLALVFLSCVAVSIPGISLAAGPAGLHDRFPPGTIDSAEKADAALAATDGEKLSVEKEYQAAARECMKKFMVNDCLDAARTRRRDRLSDVDALRIEANRYKRRDKADRIEAERAKREADRAANAKADADLRARNREAYESRQRQAKREAADRAREEAARAGRPPAAHRPVKSPKPGSPEAEAAQRAKNAAAQAARIREAAAHREQLARRHAQREAERARRAQARAKKAAERDAAQRPGGTAAKPGP